MTGWTEHSCATNGITLHYTRTGPGKPPLILLHGLAANGACWTDVAQALEDDCDVILPDLRGHGKSSVPVYGYRYEDHAADIAGLIEALNLGPIFLVGHSMGGLVAAAVASKFPTFVRRLILADPTFISIQQQREVRDSEVAEQHRRLLKKPLEDLVAELHARHPHRSLANIERIARARLQTSLAAFDVLTPPNPDYESLVRSIIAPTLLVTAERGVVSKDAAASLQTVNPLIQTAEIVDAGHGLYYDQPERFSEAARTFLEEGHGKQDARLIPP
jgi:pimeloyl-ACP methyl ester carboxylesterase